ncbi:MAG: hypothetical protein ACFFCQ_07645 [Promethearchaeota archaeon]
MLDAISQSPKYGYMLLEFSDIGPEPLIWEDLPVEDETACYDMAKNLGLYLFLIASQGTGSADIGFYGPLPFKEIPHHDLIAFSFFSRDPTVQDPRTKIMEKGVETGVMTFFVILVPRTDNKLTRALVALENALHMTFVERYPKKPIIIDETLPILLSQGKTTVWRTIKEGEKLLQEEAMELIFQDSRVLFLSFYNENNRSLVIPVIGEEEEYRDKIESIRDLKMDIFLYTYRKDRKIGFISFSEYQKFAIAIFENTSSFESGSFTREDFFEFGRRLYFALPLLREYYSIDQTQSEENKVVRFTTSSSL